MRLTYSSIACLALILADLLKSAIAGELNIAAVSYTVAENGSTLQVSVNRTGTVAAAAGVTIKSIDGTATAGNDFKAVSAALAWTAGSSDSETINVTITDDATIEGSESFTLQLQNPTGDTIGSTATATVTITDYEEGTIEFAVTEFSAQESNGSANIEINRVNGDDGEVGITIKTADNTAKADSDYEPLDLAVSFEDGETSKTVPLTLIDDELAELSETLSLTLSAVSGGAILGSSKTATLTILDTDSDFTPSLKVIELESAVISQPALVDLEQASIMDSQKTYLEIINDISVLQIGGVEADQSTSGLMEIVLGTDKFYFYPIAIRRSGNDDEPSVFIAADHSANFITDQNISISVQPALGGLAILQSYLAEVELPEVVVTDGGNITIQMNQGPAPYEINHLGQLVINNSFYNRWHFRPFSMARISAATKESVGLVPHPVYPDETMVLVVFKDGLDYREQYLSTAPIDASELINAINARAGISKATVLDYGMVSITSSLSSFAGISGATSFTLYADYEVRRATSNSTLLMGFFDTVDVNGDGLQDFRMVYENGDEQYFFLMGIE